MTKINKYLIFIIIIILPIAVVSFTNKETNFFDKQSKDETPTPNITVRITKNNQVIETSLEEYLVGVVGAEMPALFHEEALKAQAVAARTFALNKINVDGYIETNTSDQAYLTKEELQNKWQEDFSSYYARITEAVNSTKNIVITYGEELIHAYYYSMSNGYTEDSKTVFNDSQPYLNVIESRWETTLANFSVTTTMSYEKFLSSLNIKETEFSITNVIRNESNRVTSITINNTPFTGIEIRQKLSLRSTDFNINKVGDNIEITTKGYGHGVGMSQYGANELAKNNYSYQEILNYYYPDTNLTNYIV